MSNDGISPEDQAAVSEVARGVMQKLAAGRSAEDVARELCLDGWQKSTADGLVEHVQQDWRRIEAAPQANAALYLQMKYPEMRPVGSVPTLQTVHGIGTTFYGSRDLDRPTGTFVKTQCFSVLFVPILALKSYRVARCGTGWTLIGRVPLSRFAKTWNILFLCAVLGSIGWGVIDGYLNSPGQVASRKLARADEAAAAGKLPEASRLYREVAHTPTEHAHVARERCVKLIERPEIDSLPLRDVTQIFDDVIESRLPGIDLRVVPARGLAIVKSHAQAEPTASIELLGRVARISASDACKAFGELVKGPFAGLPSAETVAIFRAAAAMPQDDEQKAALVNIGVEQCRRLAASDLPSAADLLAVLAPLGDRPAVDKCLADLVGPPLDKAPCADVTKVLRVAKEFAGPMGEKELFKAGIAWVEHHPQMPQHEVFDLLDLLAELHGTDQARVAAIRRRLLEKLVAADPQDAELTVQLALALEAESQPATKQGGSGDPSPRIVKLLSPLREKLGVGEGARLLGQALAAQGKFDESYVLLGPYLEKRLDAFHEAEQGFQDAIEQVQSRVIAQLRNGNAPGFDFQRANRVSEDERRAMVLEYVVRQVKDDPGVDAAREKRAKQGMVVPAALDLGMVTLQRAQSMKDPAVRRAELERAEKTFLAIRGTAGESDQYMLHLGQVYYWLGKQNEGRQEFEKMLAKHQRKAEILYALAEVLRDLGATAEARKLLEEGYEKAPDKKVRQSIAHLRAITSTGLDDEIHWLERCDASDANVKALLAESRGSQAEIQGKDDEAAADYREAVAIYEREPQNTAVLNNGALASLALFEITGERQALDRSAQWLEKAAALSPMDALVLSNASSQMLRAAIQDLAGDKLNLRDLQSSSPVSALYFLAGDQKALDGIRQRAREHAGLRKCLGYLDRVSVLSPKNVVSNASALVIYSFLRDREALQRLARQVTAAKPDVEESNAKSLEYYHYQDEDSRKEKMRAKAVRAEALVAR